MPAISMKSGPRKTGRFLVPSDPNGASPPAAIYHVVTRVVDRQFVFGDEEKEHLRLLLRMYERFSGCRILSYCLMSNHLHVLLEVPSGCGKGETLGLSDQGLLYRLGGLYSRNYCKAVELELQEARALIDGNFPRAEGEKMSPAEVDRRRREGEEQLEMIHARYSYRMHSLSEFFKGMLQRFTCWFNRQRGRKGTLWESRFRSVIVQDGLAARTISAYIDLNPVRAGIVEDPADYRWSSYGEAVGGGRGAKKAQLGLVRAFYAFGEKEAASRSWAQGGVAKAYRKILIQTGTEQTEADAQANPTLSRADQKKVLRRRGIDKKTAEKELARLAREDSRDLKITKAIQCRVRYFTDGAVIGSKDFLNTIFARSRDRFTDARIDGARKPRGSLGELAGEIWSMRDLKIQDG